MREPKRPVLAHGKVRHVGDAYAAVVAETYQQAKDAGRALLEGDLVRRKHQLGGDRRLIRLGHAGHLADGALPGPGVEPLRICW
jgi:hypothetical protein